MMNRADVSRLAPSIGNDGRQANFAMSVTKKGIQVQPILEP